jgi:5-methyltetrahydropteroyltriglutamate--homocysteine methyltransferase
MPLWRSDVVGSLLRPHWLMEARDQVEHGTLSAAEFKRIEDRAVDEAIALQEAADLDVVTDGEMRRYAFFGHLIEAVAGRSPSGTLTAMPPRSAAPSSSGSCAGGGR